ncbi:peptidylprolyl isomerase [Promethearchaeum syntrophicum]|uniref:peptidylprolyl isomerase n=1 Tax=Promethearchaeum syntrophicum TaxID=2594042 RepID=A0A5B9D8P6_9ARCH|nr:hypothetical protein [Candidatus Prometheoarchaeum syntrophicum]QEE15462.1 Putative FKBP-type peptidyl-prolyl cis-trans isomerase [Candidatus Prometheoarchaeum syntrophicum]
MAETETKKNTKKVTKKVTKKATKKTTKKATKKSTKKPTKKTTKKVAKEEPSKVDVETEVDNKAKEEAEKKKKLKTKKVKIGDMVSVDIRGKTIEPEDPKREIVFQASNPEDAQMLPNYDPKKLEQYVPDLAIIGKQGFITDSIDAVIQEGIKYFEEKIIQLEPADAFGERVGNKIEKVSAKQFKKDMNEEPRPGATYKDKKGRSGTVLRAAQGRLLVDFNHPLAGRKIEYKIKVIDCIEGFDNQVKALLGRRMPGLDTILNEFKIKHIEKESILEIELPQMFVYQIAQQQGGLYFKMGASMDIQEHLGIETVKFVEVYAKPPVPEVNHDEHDHDHHNHDHDHKEK